MSALRRTTEEWVSEDWAAVAKAINERVNELGWKQRELAERSQGHAMVGLLGEHVFEGSPGPVLLIEHVQAP